MNQLDFAMLPSLQTGSMFAQLPPGLDQKLQRFGATYDRAHGALFFSASMCNTPTSDDGSDIKLREALLRAALGEYASMEEAIYYDDPTGGHTKITGSQNPLLHIMKQLRNMQFHLLSSPLTSGKQGVVWASEEFEMQFWYVQDITINDFNRLQNAHRYHAADKSQMIQWFNINQRKWGVNQLIIEAVSAYTDEIVT